MRAKSFYVIAFACLLLCACSKTADITYRFTALHLQLLDNRGALPEVVQADSLPARAFGIRLLLSPQELSRTKGDYDMDDSQVSNINPITEIRISSSDSFGLYLPPGALLNYSFVEFKGDYSQNVAFGEKPINPTTIYQPDAETNYLPQYTDLLLVKAPFRPGRHRFKVELSFQDKTVFTDTTAYIKLY